MVRARADTDRSVREVGERHRRVLGVLRGGMYGASGAFEADQGRRAGRERFAEEGDPRAEGLVLRRGRGATARGEAVAERGALGLREGARLTAGVDGEEGAGPGGVRRIRARGVAQTPVGEAQGVDEGQGMAPGAVRGRGGPGVFIGPRDVAHARGRKWRQRAQCGEAQGGGGECGTVREFGREGVRVFGREGCSRRAGRLIRAGVRGDSVREFGREGVREFGRPRVTSMLGNLGAACLQPARRAPSRRA